MNELKISIFKELFKTDVPYAVTLSKVVDRLINGASKDKILSIRNGNKDLKKKLPCITFAGVFSQRNKNGLINHSGLMVIDFDKVDNPTKYKKKLQGNKHFCLLFISPSGDGVKGVVRINPCDSDKHSKVFKKFNDDFKLEYLDISGSNVDRVCFESYDKDAYVNYNAELYNPSIIDEGYSVSDRVPLLPISDDSKKIELILNFNWQKDFVEGQRNSFILDIAGSFCEYGITELNASNYLSQYICKSFTSKELDNTIKNAYRLRSFNSKFFEDNNSIKAIKLDLKKGKDFVIDKHEINKETFDVINDEFVSDDFWIINNKGKVYVEPLKYKIFLEISGFKKYFPSSVSKPNLVFIDSNKVEETTTEKIKDFVLNYLSERSEFDVWNYCANYSNLFAESYLSMLDTIELSMLNDKVGISYIAFNNGILEVSKNKTSLVDYIDVDGYVWKNQIINRDYTHCENHDNEYETFINNISNNEPMAIECTIGYLISSYKNKMNNKAIILNDEVISENPEGGTGKGLFIQGIKQIRKTAILDGKSFDDKKSFPYQTVSQDTSVLVFDDVKKNFNFETKFSLVTEGLTLERKNKDAIKLTVEESPKLVLSTNYAIKGEGNSHDRRRHELEFAQYYNGEKTPHDEFGRQLFDDWNNDDYKSFDNYMICCLQLYLQNGLVNQNAKNIKLRKFIAESSMEFFEWISDTENIRVGVRLDKSEMFNKFIDDYSDFKRWLTKKKFNIWIQKYAKYSNLDYKDGNSNGQRWFSLGDDNTDELENDLPF